MEQDIFVVAEIILTISLFHLCYRTAWKEAMHTSMQTVQSCMTESLLQRAPLWTEMVYQLVLRTWISGQNWFHWLCQWSRKIRVSIRKFSTSMYHFYSIIILKYKTKSECSQKKLMPVCDLWCLNLFQCFTQVSNWTECGRSQCTGVLEHVLFWSPGDVERYCSFSIYKWTINCFKQKLD